MPVTRNQSNSAERSQAAVSAAAAVAAAAVAAAEDINGPKDSSDNGETSLETELPRPDSPENCSICLGPFSNKSFTSSCAHSFCFICLKQWSKVKAECPLCKQSFTSIFHSIRSNDSYDIYELPPINPPNQLDYDHFYNLIGGNLNAFATTRHYMSLPQPRLDADLTLSNFSRFQFRNRRYDRYLNPVHPAPSEHQYSFSNAAFNPSSHVSAASWPMGTDAFRLHVYRYHMGPPAAILGCENNTYRLTPAMVNASAHRMQRIMPWLTRELRVLLRNHQSVRLAISVIQPLLSQVTVDSEYFSGRVSPLIGQRSGQFIQEFIAFTNSALTMQAFDRKAMYRRHMNRFWVDNTSSSSSDDDDVVEITNVSPDVNISSVAASTSTTVASLQRARWDSPTPGPSWEIMDSHTSVPQLEGDQVSVSSESDPVFQPNLNDSEADSSEAGSDIVFVKFDKPWNERSPVKVSSDSEGGGQNRKHKKSKHKKKRRETLDTSIESTEKDKKHKSSKSRSKERVRPSISDSEDEFQQEAEVNVSVPLSSDKHKRKKHRRSKEKHDDAKRHKKSDRELVDKLFAEALTQQRSVDAINESRDTNIPSSSKSRDKGTAKSSGKERHRRKRKKKSRSSASPSVLSSYKKHHSGHKKTSDKHESEKRKHKRKRKSKENAASDYSSKRAASLEKEQQIPRNQPTANGHSLTSTFQASYLTGTDNVQHIPLNLWVTTWPSLPVTHKFPTPSTSTSFPPSSLPQSLPASSSFSSQHLNYSSEHTNSAMNSQTISSDSQSSSDSDTGHHPRENVHRAPDCSRTRQWLDANFPGLRQHHAGSHLLQTSETSNSARNWSLPNATQPNRNTFAGACDVVSVASGDEDIFVSSASSTKSDSAEVMAIENCDMPQSIVSISSHDNSITGSSVFKQVVTNLASSHCMPSVEKAKKAKAYSSSSKNISSLPCSSFQPFKLHKKSPLAKQTVNPIFSRIAQNSDDDGDEAVDANHSMKPQTFDQEKTSSVEDTLRNSSIDADFKTNLTSSRRLETSAGPLNSPLQAILSSPVTVPVLERSHLSCLNSEQNVPTASASSSSSSAIEPVFSMLPPLPVTAATAVTTPLTSSLSYLPYTSLSVPAPLPSILSLPFAIPQAPFPASLPLHFSYPSLLPTSSTIFPAYASTSQDAHSRSVSNNTTLRKGSDSSCPLLPADGKFAVDIENDKNDFLGKAAREGTEISSSACQLNCATVSKYKGVHGSEAESFSSERSPASEKLDNEIFPSSHIQDVGETEEFMETP